MAQTADQTGIASLGMLDRMMGPIKADKTRNVITAIGDMTPMAPDIRKMVGAEELGMGETAMASMGLITGIPMVLARGLAKGSGAVDEAVELLTNLKSTEAIEEVVTNIFKEGRRLMKIGADEGGAVTDDYIKGANLTNNAQRIQSKLQETGHLNRNFNVRKMEDMDGMKAGGYVYRD